MNDAPEKVRDVVVVGAGPAGSVAAILLARRGFSVLLVDRHQFPRDKVCGDGLVQDSLGVLTRLGLLDRVRERAKASSALRVYAPDRTAVDLHGEFLCIRRLVFDEMLVRAAAEAGAELVDGAPVESIDTEGANVTATFSERGSGGRGPVRARLAILATGAAGPLLEAARPGAGTAYTALAARAYFRSTDSRFQDRLVISYDKAIAPGYGWLFPLPDGNYNVGCGLFLDSSKPPANLSRLFDAFLRECPDVAEFVGSAEQIGRFTGAPLRCGMKELLPARDRLIVVGEAQGATFPFSGEGIGKAMESAELAADVAAAALREGDLSAARLSTYTDRLRAELQPRYRAYDYAQRCMGRPWVANLLARRASKSPWLREVIEATMAETMPPDYMFRPSTLLRSLFK